MRRHIVTAFALALLAVPAASNAQPGDDAPRGRPPVFGPFGQGRGRGPGFMLEGRNPIDAILDANERLQLELTGNQIARLAALRDALEEEIRPHREALASIVEQARQQTRENRDPALLEQVRTHTETIREATREAINVAREEILTEEQVARLRSMPGIRPRGGPGRGPLGPGRGPGGPDAPRRAPGPRGGPGAGQGEGV